MDQVRDIHLIRRITMLRECLRELSDIKVRELIIHREIMAHLITTVQLPLLIRPIRRREPYLEQGLHPRLRVNAPQVFTGCRHQAANRDGAWLMEEHMCRAAVILLTSRLLAAVLQPLVLRLREDLTAAVNHLIRLRENALTELVPEVLTGMAVSAWHQAQAIIHPI